MAMRLTVSVGDSNKAGSNPPHRLAHIGFGASHGLDVDDPFSARVGLPPLSDPTPTESWWTDQPVATGRDREIAFATDGQFVLGHLLLEESGGGDLATVGEHAYRMLLDTLHQIGDLHLIRVWNYLFDINGDQGGLERYRSFCIGRHRAFCAESCDQRPLPAACAVGSQAQGLLISFLAAAQSGNQIENPRQVSAFRYPPCYGPKSPSFSRAMRYPCDRPEGLLFISGTASIIGHATMHVGSRLAQLDETCRNLDAVLAAAGGHATYQAIRVYVRHPEDWPALAARCRAQFDQKTAMVALRSAICRSDLLVEIEGVASLSGAA